MEPISLLAGATAFADVVSLLNQFLSSRRERKAQTIDDFLEWLRRQNHEQVVSLLAENAEAAHAISVLLSRQHEEVMAKLTGLGAAIGHLASQMPDFHDLAVAINPASALSEQALSILRQMNALNASRFRHDFDQHNGHYYTFLDGVNRCLEVEDERFIRDDLETLCEMDLLRLDFNAQGDRIYVITRLGAEIGKLSSDR